MTTRAAKPQRAENAAQRPAAADKIHAGGRLKPERQLKIVPADPAAQLAEWVDELGALEQEMITIRPKLTRVETLRGLIRERFADKEPHKAFEARGARFTATLGPCAYERSLDSPALCKAIGLKAYAAIARPTLKAATEAVAPHIMAKCVTQAYAGARPLKTFPLNQGE